MSNRTDPLTWSVHGTNPQFLIGQVTRKRIYDHQYWKEHCFGLSAETLVDKAVGLQYIGGTYGGNCKPTPFLCLLLKLLQIGPSEDVVEEYIHQTDFKYLQALGAMYLRLTGTPVQIYQNIEPLLNDNRLLRMRKRDGRFELIHMDVLADDLLNTSFALEVDLPTLPARHLLEESPFIELEPRVSLMQERFDEMRSKKELDSLPLPQSLSDVVKWTK